MSKSKGSDLFKRYTTRHRGITYRERQGGARTYAVYNNGTYITVEGGEQEALALQADLRAKRHRGEHVPKPSKATFAEVAEQWFDSKRRLRAWTRKSYRASLDRVLLPRFGSMRVAAITVDDVAALIRDLDRQGLATAYIENHLKPLTGTLGFAVRRRMITVNPCTLLTRDDRPERRERTPDHVWSDEEIEALISAGEAIHKQPASRFNYAPLLRVACYTGLRLGELLGLQWGDLDLQEGVMQVQRQYTRLGEYGPPNEMPATYASIRQALLHVIVEAGGPIKASDAIRTALDRHPLAGKTPANTAGTQLLSLKRAGLVKPTKKAGHHVATAAGKKAVQA